jgi:myo-inositol-1(or 4)-monophosphatase
MTTIPSQADLLELLQSAKNIADGADQILLEGYGKVTASEKPDGTLVTEIDRAVDAYVASHLAAAYPDHAVLSEEATTLYNPSKQFTWVIDPLDGTTNYARGLPIWGISIALLSYGIPVVGLLSFVSLHERYSAIHAGGARLNDLPIHTAGVQAADDQHFMMICTRTPRRYRIDSLLKPRILGSAAYHLAAVAASSALAGIEATPKLWDIAAALLILTEAGGCYTCLDQRASIFPLLSELSDYASTTFPLLTAANQSILSELEGHVARY